MASPLVFPVDDDDDDDVPNNEYSGSHYLSQYQARREPVVSPSTKPYTDPSPALYRSLDKQWDSSFGPSSAKPDSANNTPEWSFYIPFEKMPSLAEPLFAADEACRLFPLYIIHLLFHRTHLIVSVLLLVLLVVGVIYAMFDRSQSGDQDGQTVKGQTRY